MPAQAGDKAVDKGYGTNVRAGLSTWTEPGLSV